MKGGGVGWTRPPTVRPLIELELREKNERVALDETEPTVSFLTLGQLFTFEVRSTTSNSNMDLREN